MDLNPLNWTAAPFLTLYVGLAAAVFVLGAALRAAIGSGPERSPRLNALEWAYLAGGPLRLGDVALLCLASSGGGAIDGKTQKISVTDQAPLAALSGERLTLAFWPDMSRRQFQTALAPLVEQVRARMERIGYAPSATEVASFRLAALAPIAALLALGAAKAIVGAARGHPVGILLVLLGLTAVGAFVLAARPLRTRAGAAALRAHRAQNARSARAPLDRELLLAVALSGAVVLAGTEFAPIYAASRSSSDGGGDGGGGGCGGGGGGCGGCS